MAEPGTISTRTLRFTSPSGKGVASAILLRRGDVEYVEVEVELLREMLADLGFVEETPPLDFLPSGETPLMPESHDSGSDRG